MSEQARIENAMDAAFGIRKKYLVKRIGGTPRKHDDCSYFVLDLQHDFFAGPALLAYADACEAKHEALAHDLRAMAKDIVQRTALAGDAAGQSAASGAGRPVDGRRPGSRAAESPLMSSKAEAMQGEGKRVNWLNSLFRRQRTPCAIDACWYNDHVYYMTVKLYCQCGDALHATAAFLTMVERVAEFWHEHSGDGHGPTTPEIARRARRKRQGL